MDQHGWRRSRNEQGRAMRARGDIYPWTRMPRSLDKDTPFGRAVVPPSRAKSPGGAGSVTAGELVAASTNIVRVEVGIAPDIRGERLWQKAWRSK